MKPILYYGYEISQHDYYLPKCKNKYLIRNTIDCDAPLDFSESIEEAKILINEKLEIEL